ncbi:hypothetical protein CR513_34211, partial [Mucuna pruriens]
MYISGGDDTINYKLFLGTLRSVEILLSRTIHTFYDLETVFASQFATNRAKRLEVDDPNQKFFVKAFHKGLRVGQFNDSLALRTWVEKHIEAKEDMVDPPSSRT